MSFPIGCQQIFLLNRAYRETCVIDSNVQTITKHSENNGLALIDAEVNYMQTIIKVREGK